MSVHLAKSGNRSSLSLSGTGKSGKSGTSAASANTSVENKDAEKITNSSNDNETKKSLKNDATEIKPLQTGLKKDENSKQENVFTNGHKQNENKKEEKKVVAALPDENVTSTSEKKEPVVRESQRNKEKQQQKDEKHGESPKKADSKTTEKTGKKIEKDKEKISDETEKKKITTEKTPVKKESTAETPAKRIEKKLSQSSQDSVTESAKKGDKKSQENVEQKLKEEKKSKITQDVNTQAVASSVQDSRESTVNQEQPAKEKKADEIEPLVFEVENETPGQPGASSTPGRVLRPRLCAPLPPEQHFSTTQKVHSESDETGFKNAFSNDSTSPLMTYPGRISGRRSIRRMPEVSFENRYAGYYRQIPDDDRWTSSMNVTIGSEIPNETASSSFSFFGRGKKREHTPPITINNAMGSQESELSPKGPKRARLDFSGLLGIMASPMTLLRAKFSRTKIQSSSTPNAKVNNDQDICGTAALDDVENVSGIVSEAIATEAIESANNDVLIDQEGDISIQNGEDVADDKDIFKLDDDDADIIKEKVLVTTDENTNKRRVCNVM